MKTRNQITNNKKRMQNFEHENKSNKDTNHKLESL